NELRQVGPAVAQSSHQREDGVVLPPAQGGADDEDQSQVEAEQADRPQFVEPGHGQAPGSATLPVLKQKWNTDFTDRTDLHGSEQRQSLLSDLCRSVTIRVIRVLLPFAESYFCGAGASGPPGAGVDGVGLPPVVGIAPAPVAGIGAGADGVSGASE